QLPPRSPQPGSQAPGASTSGFLSTGLFASGSSASGSSVAGPSAEESSKNDEEERWVSEFAIPLDECRFAFRNALEDGKVPDSNDLQHFVRAVVRKLSNT